MQLTSTSEASGVILRDKFEREVGQIEYVSKTGHWHAIPGGMTHPALTFRKLESAEHYVHAIWLDSN